MTSFLGTSMFNTNANNLNSANKQNEGYQKLKESVINEEVELVDMGKI